MGRLYNQSESKRKQYHDIQLRMQAVEAEVASMEEFQHLDGFAVVYQPFSLELSVRNELLQCIGFDIMTENLNIFFFQAVENIRFGR